MKLLKSLLVILFIYASTKLPAQVSPVDSLLSILKTAKEDTNKVNILFQLSEQCVVEDILKYAQQSLALAEKLKYEKGIANAYNNIAFVYHNQGQIQKALEYYSQALAIQEKIKNDVGLATALSNVASIYDDQNQIEKSLEYNLRALKLFRKINRQEGVGISLNNIGVLYRSLGQIDKSLEYYLQSLEVQKENNYTNEIALTLNNIGVLYEVKGKPDIAADYYSRALVFAEKTNNKRVIAVVLTSIGKNYFNKKNYIKAEEYCSKGLKTAMDINHLTTISQASEQLSKIYAAQKKYKQAFEVHLLFKQMADSLRNEETQRASVKHQMQYEFEKKEAAALAEQEKKDEITRQESQKQKVISWSILSGLLLVLAFSAFVLNRWQVTQKQKVIIEKQKVIVEKKNQNITDSINYAQRIQRAIFPKENIITPLFNDHFIFFRPKDVVSGDFYWVENKEDKIIFSVSDCTGHGVPGAFMSMMGNGLLNEIVNQQHIEEPDEILNHLRDGIIHGLKQSDDIDSFQDGMEIGLCVLNKKTNILSFSGAYNSLYHFSNKKFTEYQGDKQGIGYERGMNTSFTKHTITVQSNDCIYLFTDGFADQKGGVDKRKFYYKPFKELIASIHHLPMAEQGEILTKVFNEWKGNGEQIDDVLVMGVRI